MSRRFFILLFLLLTTASPYMLLTTSSSSAIAETSYTVTDVQQRLINLGYMTGSADGMWGPYSIAAWHSFQELNGLPITNKADSTTLGAIFSDDAKALPEGLDIGDQGDRVTALQQKLIQYGFLTGDRKSAAVVGSDDVATDIADDVTASAIETEDGVTDEAENSAVDGAADGTEDSVADGAADGAYGKKTAAAVTHLQQHLIAQGCNIVANGIATPLTLFYLDNGTVSFLHDVGLYTDGGEAKRVETRLTTLGYMDTTPDASFDSIAVDALKQFQEDAGLPITSVADEQTYDILFSATAPSTDHSVLHAINSGERGQVIERVEEAMLLSGMSVKLPNGRFNAEDEDAIINHYRYFKDDPDKVALFSYRTKLSKNAVESILDGIGPGTGNVRDTNEVLRIQRRLHTLFYLSKDGIDGFFGGNSLAALREFQRINGLPETGVADESTLTLLFSATALSRPFPYRVEVSLTDQIVTVYQMVNGGANLGKDEQYEQIKRFSCSTGLNNTTPRGIFLDGFPLNRWHYFKKFDCWAQYSFEVEGNILFHSVLYSKQDESALRNGSVWSLGTPASHGCIRLQVEDAKWLFENCKRGSLVIVIR